MKNFLTGVLEWKAVAAMMFSASVILCGAIMLYTGATSMPLSVLASLLVISMCGTFLQIFAFSDYFIKKVRYTLRVIVFVIPFFILLIVNAWFFQWFPIENTIHWLTFSGIFLIVFIGGIISFEIYFRVMGKKYDGLLGQYRKQRDMESKF